MGSERQLQLPLKQRRRKAGELGFEPRLKESESFVLPLHHSPVEIFFNPTPSPRREVVKLTLAGEGIHLANRCAYGTRL
jgi:hypothetical protein